MNDLARIFYERAGKEIEEGFDFSASGHGEEQLMFALAHDSFKYFEDYEKLKKKEEAND